MSFNTGFMAELLEFADAHTYAKATFDIEDFINIGYEKSDRFVSYLEHLAIQHYISSDDSRYPAGVNRSYDGSITLSVMPLRLTESGRSFLRARSKEAKNTLTSEKISDAKRELEHSYKKVIQADANGFQTALRSWARMLTSNPTLAGILREVRYRTEFDVQSCCDKALAAGALPQGEKQDEDVLLAYFMVKTILDGEGHQREFSDTWILSTKLNFRAVGDYTDNLQKLVVDFKNKYVTFLSRFILNQLDKLAQTIPVQSEPLIEESPMSPEDKIQFVQKLKHLKQFFEKYNEATHLDDITYDYEEWEIHYNRSQREVDEEEIRNALKKLIRLLSAHMTKFKLEYDKAMRLAQQESHEFMRQEELAHEVLRAPECLAAILGDIIEPILFELEDLPSEEPQNAQTKTKTLDRPKQGNLMRHYTKKFQVFISSTYIDLQEERKAAIHAILENGHIPAGMEAFASEDEKQIDVIKEWIKESDVFMLLIGGRYGSIPQNSEKSYIHQEYDYAKELGMPIFSIRLSEDFLTRKIQTGAFKLHEIQEKQNPQKYSDFVKALGNSMSNSCDNLDRLHIEITRSLERIQRRKTDLKGWIKGDILDDHHELQERYAALEKEMILLREAGIN